MKPRPPIIVHFEPIPLLIYTPYAVIRRLATQAKAVNATDKKAPLETPISRG